MTEPGAGSNILAINHGSSSLKFGLYGVSGSDATMRVSGEIEFFGEGLGKIQAQDACGNHLLSGTRSLRDQREVFMAIGDLLDTAGMKPPDAIGHRIVHGGPRHRQHCLIDDATLRDLEAASPFAPLHIPPALSMVRSAQEHFPGIAQAACFDTAFHARLPEVARVIPVSRALQREGVERYGFHGLSCESILRQLGNDPPHRLVIAHLGNGVSVTAVKDGQSIDTSMGMTPAGGVIMGTRCGDLDPGVLLYLLREMKFDAAMLEDLVNHRSGLLGISGVTGDMRRLRELAPSNADARLAIEMFCYSLRKQVAAMIAVLDGIDALVFTGGIGENDAAARAAICSGLSWAGIGLDPARNRSAINPINDQASRCQVYVLASQEDEQIARHTWALTHRRDR